MQDCDVQGLRKTNGDGQTDGEHGRTQCLRTGTEGEDTERKERKRKGNGKGGEANGNGGGHGDENEHKDGDGHEDKQDMGG